MFEDLRPHLTELRKRLGLSVASVFVMFVVAFSFHENILAWITQPLNDALTQVGLNIESKNHAQWKIEQKEANTTSKPEIKIVSPQGYAQEASIAAQKLHDSLHEAAAISSQHLASLLEEASHSAKQIADATTHLARSLTDAKQTETNATSKDFGGMVTTHQLGGVFFVALKVSFFAALLGALPFILYQLWLFVSPGLYTNEKRMVIPFVVGGSVMFMIGVLFSYYVVTPFGFQFLIAFGAFLYTPLINIEDYVGFFTKIMMGFGLAFELPVFAYFLALLGLVTDKTLKDFFRYAVVIIFIVAAVLTPPDVLTQFLMAIPLVLLYGLSILIVRMVNPYEGDDDEEDEDTNSEPAVQAKDS